MLTKAPKFHEVAKRIVEITTDCILVAHNASFDYRILKTEFSRLGFDFERKSLCTVELAQKLIPDQPSYSLGKLVRNLGIPLSDRHRANGDALATIKLFKLLLTKDIEKVILRELVRTETKKHMDSKLLRIIEETPSVTGVYYIHKEDGEIIYIGKSKNIKKRLNQHFTSDNAKSKKIQLDVFSVSYEDTGNELLALLKENEEIKRHKPKYNRALKKTIFSHALFDYVDDNGYIRLKVGTKNNSKNSITTFTNYHQGKSFMQRVVDEYGLCQKMTGLHKADSNCFNYGIKKCDGACIDEESPDDYNKKVRKLIQKLRFKHQNMLLIDRGRSIDEQSAILITNGELQGFCFFNLNHQINNLDILKTLITPISHNRDAQHIVQSFLRKKNRIKIVKLD